MNEEKLMNKFRSFWATLGYTVNSPSELVNGYPVDFDKRYEKKVWDLAGEKICPKFERRKFE